MASTDRRVMLEAFETQCALILTASGYKTNAGSTVYFGEVPQLSPDDADVAIAITVGDDRVADETLGDPAVEITLRVPVLIHAVSRADLDDPHVANEQVLSDIKTAIEAATTWWPAAMKDMRRLSTRTLEREPGSTSVALQIGYEVLMNETWGSP